jgi:ribosome-binding protein aMBF1 (putative translation factor)
MLNLTRVISRAKEKGLSNTFLAKKLGRSSASLFVDWRKGKSKPSEEYMKKYGHEYYERHKRVE